MKIVAVLGVKDEVEIIEQTIAHLRQIGVDLIIACDMYSTDGTAELLRRYQSDESFWFFQMGEDEDQEAWTQANLSLVRKAEADWVMFLDADEYPLPATGSLKQCSGLAEADVILIDRFNIPLTLAGPAMPRQLTVNGYEDLLLIAQPIDDYWARVAGGENLPWIRSRICGRFMARAGCIESVSSGAHDVVSHEGASPVRRAAEDLVVAHLPFSSKSRFARKVKNVKSTLATHDAFFGANLALHWRRWAAMLDQGRLDEEYSNQAFDASMLDELKGQNVVMSVSQYFQARNKAGH